MTGDPAAPALMQPTATTAAPASAAGDEDLLALQRVTDDAAAFFRAQLHRSGLSGGQGGRRARGFLAERGVPAQAAEAFGLGYAPASWHTLTAHLRSLGHSDDALLRSGVCLWTRHGRLADRFRDRLIFPIHGPDGNVTGLTGRALPTPSLVPASVGTAASRSSSQTAAGRAAPPKYLGPPTPRWATRPPACTA